MKSARKTPLMPLSILTPNWPMTTPSSSVPAMPPSVRLLQFAYELAKSDGDKQREQRLSPDQAVQQVNLIFQELEECAASCDARGEGHCKRGAPSDP
jgi:hypothetical protein